MYIWRYRRISSQVCRLSSRVPCFVSLTFIFCAFVSFSSFSFIFVWKMKMWVGYIPSGCTEHQLFDTFRQHDAELANGIESVLMYPRDDKDYWSCHLTLSSDSAVGRIMKCSGLKLFGPGHHGLDIRPARSSTREVCVGRGIDYSNHISWCRSITLWCSDDWACAYHIVL